MLAQVLCVDLSVESNLFVGATALGDREADHLVTVLVRGHLTSLRAGVRPAAN